jgi:hypothetical protein
VAEDLTPKDDVRAELVPETEPEPVKGADATAPYQSRFQLVFGALLGVGVAAIAATVLFLAVGRSGSDNGAADWSVWRPTAGDGLAAVQQIASYVGQRYTLKSGRQLVAVNSGPLQFLGLPVTITVQDPQGSVAVLNGAGVMYTLCGLGPNCSINQGKPSHERLVVLQREGLELALYTFRYVKDVDEVYVELPPPPGKQKAYAMLFTRGQVEDSLHRPLTQTLPGPPPRPDRIDKFQTGLLDRLTDGFLYVVQKQQGPDSIYFELQRPTGG